MKALTRPIFLLQWTFQGNYMAASEQQLATMSSREYERRLHKAYNILIDSGANDNSKLMIEFFIRPLWLIDSPIYWLQVPTMSLTRSLTFQMSLPTSTKSYHEERSQFRHHITHKFTYYTQMKDLETRYDLLTGKTNNTPTMYAAVYSA